MGWGVKLRFTLGDAASDELALVAEDGVGQDLAALASTLPGVADAQATSAPIPPGETVAFQISSNPGFDVLSVVSMLVNTNDAFLAIDSEPLPKTRRSSVVYRALAYDAGSEANNEDCAFIPGPACPGDSGNARETVNAEGYVYVHNGMHDSADLSAAVYDWRNPVALVKVERTR